jgi:hypothetical protein
MIADQPLRFPKRRFSVSAFLFPFFHPPLI